MHIARTLALLLLSSLSVGGACNGGGATPPSDAQVTNACERGFPVTPPCGTRATLVAACVTNSLADRDRAVSVGCASEYTAVYHCAQRDGIDRGCDPRGSYCAPEITALDTCLAMRLRDAATDS